VGLNVSIWAPPGNISALAAAMPRLDSLFFPGGDGGTLVWPSLAEAAAELRRHHPGAEIWALDSSKVSYLGR